MRSIILTGVILGLFFITTTSIEAGMYGPPGSPSCACGGPSCDDYWCQSQRNCPCTGADCLGDCGYPYRWRPGVRATCDPCVECEPCRPMTCHDRTFCGPLTPIFALFTRNSWSGSGCGERYWGDFYGDPPDWCDPCDRCGNYTGGWNGWGNGVGRNGNYVPGPSMAKRTMPYEGKAIPANAKVISKNDRVMGQVPTPASKQRKTTRW